MNDPAACRTRFAPSPSGLLHLGHAHSALVAWHVAGRDPGHFILRIEDIDVTRCRAEFDEALVQDLTWLGLSWSAPVLRQSERLCHYATALETLKRLGVVYPCFCTRREIREEVERSVNAPHGPDGVHYPGTCKRLSASERKVRFESGTTHAWRLNAAAAAECTGALTWRDRIHGTFQVNADLLGDVVVARKDIGTSYHLAVVVDDASQEIEVVTRGEDLLHCTHLHRLLQELLGLPAPLWHHHSLITDPHGKRLAKRDDAQSIRSFREAGLSVDEVIRLARGPC